MQKYFFEAKITLPSSIGEVFSFFADARNLETLTPPWLNFEIVTPGPIEMKRGTRIDYRLKLHGFPLRWRSEITAWEPPFRFVDRQHRGPYRLWIHEHNFLECDQGTLVQDRIEYATMGGRLIQKFFVLPDLKRIFAYRHDKLIEIFGPPAHAEISK